MFDILESVDQWLAMDKGVALATVVSTWGSAPRHTGAKMAVTANLEMTGSVSGGCVEAAVVEAAQATLRSGKPRRLDFGVSDDQAWEVGLACGGKIQVWVEPLEAAWWSVMREALSQERPFTAITLLEGEEAGLKLVLDQDNLPLYASAECSMERSKALSEAPRRATTGLDTLLGTAALVEVFQRRPHLIIVGGVHVATALSRMAVMLGMRVTLIDPRTAFASPERFPDIEMTHQYPDEALVGMQIGARTYIVVLTHDPKFDDPAVMAGLRGQAAYVGVLGSRRVQQQRLERLRKLGLSEQELAQMHSPIGLPIGAQTPEEIAVAIMAQMIEVKNVEAAR